MTLSSTTPSKGGFNARRRTGWHLAVLGIAFAVSACERAPTTPQPEIPLSAQQLQKSFDRLSVSPLENERFSAQVIIEVADLGTFSDGRPHHSIDTVSTTGVVKHGTGYLTIGAVPGVAPNHPGGLLVLETDAGRVHGPTKAPRHGLNAQGRMVGLDFENAADGGPVTAWRGYFDDKLVAATTYDWKRKAGRWELKGSEITYFRDGIPFRKMRISVRMDQQKLETAMSKGVGMIPQAVDGLRWVGNKALGLVAPAPLFAQTPIDPTVTTNTEWYTRVTSFLTAVLALGAAILGGPVALVMATWGLIVTGVPLVYLFETNLKSSCGSYLTALTDVDEYGYSPNHDYVMDVLCFGPGGPFGY